jgi:hypothetical protein
MVAPLRCPACASSARSPTARTEILGHADALREFGWTSEIRLRSRVAPGRTAAGYAAAQGTTQLVEVIVTPAQRRQLPGAVGAAGVPVNVEWSVSPIVYSATVASQSQIWLTATGRLQVPREQARHLPSGWPGFAPGWWEAAAEVTVVPGRVLQARWRRQPVEVLAELPGARLELAGIALRQQGANVSLTIDSALRLDSGRRMLVSGTYVGDGRWIFGASDMDQVVPSIGEIAGLLGGAEIVTSLLGPAADIRLARLGFAADFAAPRLMRMSMGLVLERPLPVIKDALTLGAPSHPTEVDVEWRPAESWPLSLDFAAVVALMRRDGTQALLAVQARLPDGMFRAALSPDVPLELADVFHHLKLDTGGLPSAALRTLELCASYRDGFVQFSAGLATRLELPVGPLTFVLTGVAVDIAAEPLAGSFTAGVGASFTVGGVEMAVSGRAAVRERRLDWAFSARLRPGDTISLKRLLAELSNGSLVLPTELIATDVALRELTVELSPTAKSFRLQGAASAKLAFPGTDIEVSRVELDLQRTAETAKVTGTLTLSAAAEIAGVMRLKELALSFTLGDRGQWSLATGGYVELQLPGQPKPCVLPRFTGTIEQKADRSTVLGFTFSKVAETIALVPANAFVDLGMDSFVLEVRRSIGPRPATSFTLTADGLARIANPVAGGTLLSVSGCTTLSVDDTITLTFRPQPDASAKGVKFGPFILIPDCTRAADGVSRPLQVEAWLGPLTITAAEDGWSVAASGGAAVQNLPPPLDMALPAELAATCEIGTDGVVLTLSTPHRYEVAIPPLRIAEQPVALGTASLAVKSLTFNLKALSLSGVIAIGLPSELNRLFGVKDGKPSFPVLRTFDSAHPKDSTVDIRLDIAGGDKPRVGFVVETSPLAQVPVNNGWITWDESPFGSIAFQVPSFRLDLDKGSFSASGGFKQEGLRLPLGLTKAILRELKVGEAAERLPDHIPIESIDLLAPGKGFGILLDRMEAGLRDAGADTAGLAAVRAAVDALNTAADRLPPSLREYLRIEVSKEVEFAIDITPDGGVVGNLRLHEKTPLKILIPNFPHLMGVKLWRLGFGEILGGSFLLAEVDAVIDLWDWPSLAAAVLVDPKARPPFLPDLQQLGIRLEIRDLFMPICYATLVPIPLPLCYRRLGIGALTLTGVGGEASVSFPKPELKLAELAKAGSQIWNFVRQPEAELDGKVLRAALPTEFSIGPTYLQLPAFVTRDKIGLKDGLRPDPAGVVATVANAIKKRSINRLIAEVPRSLRMPSIEPAATGAAPIALDLLGLLSLEADWLVATPGELVALAATPAFARTLARAGAGGSVLAVVPGNATAADEGAVVFLNGRGRIAGIVEMAAVLGLAATAQGFAARFSAQSSLLDGLVAHQMDGSILVVRRERSGPEVELAGATRLQLLGTEVFSGTVNYQRDPGGQQVLALSGSFRTPDSPISGFPLALSGHAHGRISSQALVLEGQLDCALGDLTLGRVTAFVGADANGARLTLAGELFGRRMVLAAGVEGGRHGFAVTADPIDLSGLLRVTAATDFARGPSGAINFSGVGIERFVLDGRATLLGAATAAVTIGLDRQALTFRSNFNLFNGLLTSDITVDLPETGTFHAFGTATLRLPGLLDCAGGFWLGEAAGLAGQLTEDAKRRLRACAITDPAEIAPARSAGLALLAGEAQLLGGLLKLDALAGLVAQADSVAGRVRLATSLSDGVSRLSFAGDAVLTAAGLVLSGRAEMTIFGQPAFTGSFAFAPGSLTIEGEFALTGPKDQPLALSGHAKAVLDKTGFELRNELTAALGSIELGKAVFHHAVTQSGTDFSLNASLLGLRSDLRLQREGPQLLFQASHDPLTLPLGSAAPLLKIEPTKPTRIALGPTIAFQIGARITLGLVQSEAGLSYANGRLEATFGLLGSDLTLALAIASNGFTASGRIELDLTLDLPGLSLPGGVLPAGKPPTRFEGQLSLDCKGKRLAVTLAGTVTLIGKRLPLSPDFRYEIEDLIAAPFSLLDVPAKLAAHLVSIAPSLLGSVIDAAFPLDLNALARIRLQEVGDASDPYAGRALINPQRGDRRRGELSLLSSPPIALDLVYVGDRFVTETFELQVADGPVRMHLSLRGTLHRWGQFMVDGRATIAGTMTALNLPVELSCGVRMSVQAAGAEIPAVDRQLLVAQMQACRVEIETSVQDEVKSFNEAALSEAEKERYAAFRHLNKGYDRDMLAHLRDIAGRHRAIEHRIATLFDAVCDAYRDYGRRQREILRHYGGSRDQLNFRAWWKRAWPDADESQHKRWLDDAQTAAENAYKAMKEALDPQVRHNSFGLILLKDGVLTSARGQDLMNLVLPLVNCADMEAAGRASWDNPGEMARLDALINASRDKLLKGAPDQRPYRWQDADIENIGLGITLQPYATQRSYWTPIEARIEHVERNMREPAERLIEWRHLQDPEGRLGKLYASHAAAAAQIDALDMAAHRGTQRGVWVRFSGIRFNVGWRVHVPELVLSGEGLTMTTLLRELAGKLGQAILQAR